MQSQKRKNVKRFKRSTTTAQDIISPAGGTQYDVNHLASNLGLGCDAVKAILNCDGAGITVASPDSYHTTSSSFTGIDFPWKDLIPNGKYFKPKLSKIDCTSDYLSITDHINLPNIVNQSNRTDPVNEVDVDVMISGEKVSTQNSIKNNNEKKNYHLPVPDLSSFRNNTKINPFYVPIEPGILAQTGTLDASLPGRTKRLRIDDPRDLQSPTILTYFSIFNSCKVAYIAASPSSCHSLAIDIHGQAYGWGRNDQGQIMSPACSVVSVPTRIFVESKTTESAKTNIGIFVGGAVGKSHSVLVDQQGLTYACGSNKMGQCGVNRYFDQITNFHQCVLVDGGKQSKSSGNVCGCAIEDEEKSNYVKIVQASCGENFTVLLSNMGHIYTTGLSQYGQLGNGETGEYFITASKLTFANTVKFQRRSVFVESKVNLKSSKTTLTDELKNDKMLPIPDSSNIVIASISCGKNHTIALEAPFKSGFHSRRVFTWGCGNYGCLGHNIQADEYIPRVISRFNDPLFVGNEPIKASAGIHCSMVLTENGHVYYWGKHKIQGEATMRPTVVEALANNGHVVKSLGGGGTTVFCSTRDGVTVSWGNGLYGELGYGKKGTKSSSKPKLVVDLDKCVITDVRCGYGHTLFLIRDNDNDDKAAWNKLDRLETNDLQKFINFSDNNIVKNDLFD